MINYEPLEQNNQFLLEKFQVWDKQNKLIIDVQFVHTPISESIESPFVTLVLGENGSGKSFLFKQLTKVINALYEVNAEKKKKVYYPFKRFLLKYRLGGDTYKLERTSGEGVKSYKNKGYIDFDEVTLPQKLLASAFIVNDKFIFANKDSLDGNSSYSYLGVRESSNNTYTKSVEKKTVEHLLNCISLNRSAQVMTVLEFLKFDSCVTFGFPGGTGADFSRKRDIGKREWCFCPDRPESSMAQYAHEIDIWEYPGAAGELKLISRWQDRSTKMITRNLDSYDDQETKKKYKQINCWEYQRSEEWFDQTAIKNLYFSKHGVRVKFEDCSSGEQHILFSMLGIISEINNSSIILVDEPELSLHPEWQIKYVSLLTNVFSDYQSCHFILASHSHYLVSSLRPEASSLIRMSKGDAGKDCVAELIPYSTYAWSAESIIYEVFNLRTSRNYYFYSDLSELQEIVNEHFSSENRRKKAKQLVKKLEGYTFNEKDPLKQYLAEVAEIYR